MQEPTYRLSQVEHPGNNIEFAHEGAGSCNQTEHETWESMDDRGCVVLCWPNYAAGNYKETRSFGLPRGNTLELPATQNFTEHKLFPDQETNHALNKN